MPSLAHTHKHIHTHKHTHKHTYIHTHTQTNMHKHLHTYLNILTHTQAHTLTHTCIHTFTYSRTGVCVLLTIFIILITRPTVLITIIPLPSSLQPPPMISNAAEQSSSPSSCHLHQH